MKGGQVNDTHRPRLAWTPSVPVRAISSSTPTALVVALFMAPSPLLRSHLEIGAAPSQRV
ncbi:acid phosphatase phoG-Penicillium chrysogenum [Cordyceps militaris]|uniref:Acid phosphatase phoG-Penicillium chrysogenum n=1 Tax=Cordyceps militaris TaxID=73501 RepID=A0A2H4S5E5_CORMI|nr:acid phosphatase phoG-Penicillium chrysogenum [Cordyceps militaris]